MPSRGTASAWNEAKEKPAPEVPEVHPRDSEWNEAKGASHIPEVPDKTRDLSSALAGPPFGDGVRATRRLPLQRQFVHSRDPVPNRARRLGLRDAVPFWGDVRQSARYKAREKAYRATPNATRDIGHNLGEAVALELQQNYPGLEHEPAVH